jgi:HSP20 family protein
MPDKKSTANEAVSGRFQDPTAARPGGEAVTIDPLIASVERVYEALTGGPPPPLSEEAYAPIPVERDPGEYVSQHFEQLIEALQQPSPARAASSPPLTVWENERELVLHVDLPGVKRQDLELSLDADVLSVRARRPVEPDGARLRFNERPLGSFERRVVLPSRVDRSEPSARLVDGVLEVRLAKAQRDRAAGRRAINVS